MPRQKGCVSRRKAIGRRKRRTSLQKKTFDKGQDGEASSLSVDAVNSPSYGESDEEQSNWKQAWANFYLQDQDQDSFQSNLCQTDYLELTDSDNCLANQFYVVLDKVFEYSHMDDLDVLVNKLNTELLYSKYLLLQNAVISEHSIGHLTYMNTNSYGITFLETYQVNLAVSSKFQLTITQSLKPILLVHGKQLSMEHDFWTGLPHIYSSVKDIKLLSTKLQSWHICVGNHETEYVSMMSSKMVMESRNGSIAVAFREDVSAQRGDLCYNSTIRSSRCPLLVSSIIRCKQCQLYRHSLRKKASRVKNQRDSIVALKSTPHKTMSKQKLLQKINIVTAEKKSIQTELERLKKKIKNLIISKGQTLSFHENDELLELLEEYTGDVERSYPDASSIQRLFWEQQLKFAQLKQKSQMKWHPMIIKWCLYLRSKSQKAYDVARNSGFISLPSARTLFDYSHALPSKCGFHSEYTEHLRQEAKKCGMYEEEWKSYVGILQDEIKVSEGLVYDKTSGELVGFVELDKTGNDIASLENFLDDHEPRLATSMLVVMVRGITTSLRYPFFCLATSGITADSLYAPIWETVRILEIDCHLKPLFITCDGASANRKFFKLHAHDNLDNTYWTWNPFAFPERKLYFVSDVPHLLKTTRNCFANSGAHNMARHLWKDGKDIMWTHIIRLYEDHVENSLFTELPKLTRPHVNLTSFAKMKVNLAAQVLSKTVGDALEELYGDHVSETVKFVRHMNRFFDCLNSRNLNEATHKRNQDLAAYTDVDDPRFSYLINEFLGYFDNWKRSVMARPEKYTRSDRRRMTLSQQTLDGLYISVNSIVECTKFLLTKGATFILTHRFNQDPLEEHFSHYRHKGGANDNPTVYDVKNTLTQLRVIGSTALAPIRGNITNKRRKEALTVDHTPLAKRKK